MATLLIITIFLPLLGAASMWSFSALGRDVVRRVALGFTVVTLLLACVLIANCPVGLSSFDADGDGVVSRTDVPADARERFNRFDLNDDDRLEGDELRASNSYAVTDVPWLDNGNGNIEIRFDVGLDGLSLWLFGLSALLMVTAVLVSWEAIKDNAALFYAMLLLLECGCLGVFAAGDIMLFYVFFEFTLIPLFFLIGIWGSEERRHAAMKFFLYTLAGSVLTFLGLLAIVVLNGKQNNGELTFSIAKLTESLQATPLATHFQLWIFVALLAGFAIKVPLFPLHTWLPLAHVQAPTAGSVILAGVLLKIGTYGFVRFSIPMLPEASAILMPWLLWLAVIGIIYGALVALAQSDIKRLIAYSSVSHMGFIMLGIFALNLLGLEGGTLQMINHGISTGALFAIVGMIYERYHTREIKQLGGLARRTPLLAFFMVFFTLSSIGLPGTNGFAGEFLLLLGMFQQAFTHDVFHLRIVAVLAVAGVVLGAWYMLWLVQRVFFGPLKEPKSSDGQSVKDMSPREVAALAPLAVLVLWIGVQPGYFLDRMTPALRQVSEDVAPQVEAQLKSDSSEPAIGQAEDN